MDDSRIVDLYWARDERAIDESDKKYGRMLSSLSFSLLSSREDAEECVNDTYLDAWRAMPVARPEFLGAFLSKITRRISIDRFREKHREKRGGLDNLAAELSDCVPSGSTPEEELENRCLGEAIDCFLATLGKEKRVMFVLRYFYSKEIDEIADQLQVGQAKVKTALFRIRRDLREYLEKEGLL